MYSLKLWTHPTTGAERLYINGTPRQAVYFHRAADGRVVWSSRANDQREKTGNHYEKLRKDGDAAREVAEAFSVKIGKESGEEDWNALRAAAAQGLIVPHASERGDE